ncbi:MAG: serine/threonine-protein kinase [Erythrobacter sp.]|uniref:serine/threonine protein kinase n=1 Tax=Erythrobacter sp. TaxID=1042 RepID=UPI0032993EEA
MSMPLPPNIGRYNPTSFLGAGGMQNVFLAHDGVFERAVALKVPKLDAQKSRFSRTARVSAQINHPNVAKTLDYFADDTGSPYLIEEFVDGMDLSKIAKLGLQFLPPTLCARLFHQLLKGLTASHAAGVVHRDLKPSNIMVEGGVEFANVKITDFGIAKMAEEEIAEWAEADDQTSTNSATVLGAIPYMSPESIQNFRDASFPSDVWAIAAIVFELLTGKKPFGGNLASVPRILSGVVPPLPNFCNAQQYKGLAGELDVLIRSCLIVDPGKRPTAASLERSLQEICYSTDAFEVAEVSSVPESWYAFLKAPGKKPLMCHRDSLYGASSFQEGEKLLVGRHLGSPNDRAFPAVKFRTQD